MNNKDKYNDIHYWRLIFTYIVCVFHMFNAYGIGTGWYIAVEFFFVVSGFLLAAEVRKKRFDNAYSYTFSRIRSFMPYYVFSYIIALLLKILSGSFQINKAVSEYFFEFLFLNMAGLNLTDMINVPAWYLSVLLISGYAIFYLLLNHRKIYIHFIAPSIILFAFSYLWRNYGSIQVPSIGVTTVGLINAPVLRGLADMSAGVLIYYVSEYIKSNKKMDFSRWYFRMIRLFCYGFVVLGSLCKGYTEIDFIYFVFICTAVFLSFNDSKIKVPELFLNWEKITFSIYLNHNIFREYAPKFIAVEKMGGVERFAFKITGIQAVYLIVITLYSIMTYVLINSIIKLVKKKYRQHRIISG